MSCTSIDKEVGCYTASNRTKQAVFIQTEYGKDADGNTIPLRTLITDALSQPVTGANGTNTTPGACPVFQPDVEWERLCDVQSNGDVVPFFCQVVTSFDNSGLPISPSITTNYQLDKVTAYTPSGTVSDCPACPAVTAQGLVTSWG